MGLLLARLSGAFQLLATLLATFNRFLDAFVDCQRRQYSYRPSALRKLSAAYFLPALVERFDGIQGLTTLAQPEFVSSGSYL